MFWALFLRWFVGVILLDIKARALPLTKSPPSLSTSKDSTATEEPQMITYSPQDMWLGYDNEGWTSFDYEVDQSETDYDSNNSNNTASGGIVFTSHISRQIMPSITENFTYRLRIDRTDN